MRFFWLIIALIGGFLLLLNWHDAASSTLENDSFAHALSSGIIALLIVSSLLASGIKMGQLLRHCLIWFVVVIGLVLSYHYRYALQDMGHQLSAGLIPASPLARYEAGNLTVTLLRGRNGHFETRALVNGQEMRFMLDTGASRVVLSHEDARRLGFNDGNLNYSVTTSTANGLTQAAPIRLKSINISGIERQNVSALVARAGSMSGNLLGMNFLNSLSGYNVRADQLTLID